MINLMPPAHKETVLYARRNFVLVRWVIAILIATVGIAVVAGGGLFYLKQDTAAYQKAITDTKDNLKEQDEEETLAKVGELSGSFSLVVDVLSREVLFSKLLQHLGTLMPEGTILRNLSLSRDFEGGLDLTIGAVDYYSASQALVNLQDSSSLLFTSADANKIGCENPGEEYPYMCTATMRALFADDNPFLMLNQGAENDQ